MARSGGPSCHSVRAKNPSRRQQVPMADFQHHPIQRSNLRQRPRFSVAGQPHPEPENSTRAGSPDHPATVRSKQQQLRVQVDHGPEEAPSSDCSWDFSEIPFEPNTAVSSESQQDGSPKIGNPHPLRQRILQIYETDQAESHNA
ncbi:hypothetical protein ACLOJK_018814 [Asimina triloba]